MLSPCPSFLLRQLTFFLILFPLTGGSSERLILSLSLLPSYLRLFRFRCIVYSPSPSHSALGRSPLTLHCSFSLEPRAFYPCCTYSPVSHSLQSLSLFQVALVSPLRLVTPNFGLCRLREWGFALSLALVRASEHAPHLRLDRRLFQSTLSRRARALFQIFPRLRIIVTPRPSRLPRSLAFSRCCYGAIGARARRSRGRELRVRISRDDMADPRGDDPARVA